MIKPVTETTPDDGPFKLASGRVLDPVVGVSADLVVFEGYDGRMEPLTASEACELADTMVARWMRLKEFAKDGSCPNRQPSSLEDDGLSARSRSLRTVGADG